MGWKASCIVIKECHPGYLGTAPTHDPERARRLIADLGLGPCRSRGMEPLKWNLYPEDLAVGAYDGAAFLAAPEAVGSCFAASEPGRSPLADPLLGAVLRAFPKAAVLCVVLHGVVDMFGYAYYEGGRLVRAFGGSDGDPILMDVGEWQPEERPLFEGSVVQNGERPFRVEFDGGVEEVDAPSVGVGLAFEMTGRFFGSRLDRLPARPEARSPQVECFDRDSGRRQGMVAMDS